MIDSSLEPLAMEWVIAMRQGHALANNGLGTPTAYSITMVHKKLPSEVWTALQERRQHNGEAANLTAQVHIAFIRRGGPDAGWGLSRGHALSGCSWNADHVRGAITNTTCAGAGYSVLRVETNPRRFAQDRTNGRQCIERSRNLSKIA